MFSEMGAVLEQQARQTSKAAGQGRGIWGTQDDKTYLIVATTVIVILVDSRTGDGLLGKM